MLVLLLGATPVASASNRDTLSQGARDEYERALSLYDRANQLLAGDDPSDVELYEARRSLEEGRARLEAARATLAQPPAN